MVAEQAPVDAPSAANPDRRWPFAVLAIAWIVFLALQPGHLYDEGEHAHIAWLMAVLREQPLRDFFQHHPPLLWQVLGLYFRAHGDGPEVLYFGRGLVVGCWALFYVALRRIARRSANPSGLRFPGDLAVLLLAASTIALNALPVIRPESLGVGLFSAMLLLWPHERSAGAPLRALAAGAAFGLAVLATPRFLVLAPALPLLEYRIERADLRRYGFMAAGAIGVVASYFAAGAVSWSVMLFDVGFSAYLQRVGSGKYLDLLRMIPVLLLLAATAWNLAGRSRPSGHQRAFVLIAFYGVLVTICLASAGRFYYQQTIAPASFFGLMMIAALEAPGRYGGLGLDRLALGLAVLALCMVELDIQRGATLPQWVTMRRTFLEFARHADPKGEVLLNSALHPIAFRDASYYGVPLVDAEDRLCRAVQQSRWARQLPRCDYTQVIVSRRPLLLDSKVLAILPPQQLRLVEPILLRDYFPLYDFLVRKPGVHHAVGPG